MKIDIHRHAKDPGRADRVLRNLFHDQGDQIEKGAYFSAGLHPWHVKSESLKEDLDLVSRMAARDEVIAIGEAGLDKSIKVDLDLQKRVFMEQVRLAIRLDKPMIIHCVRAYNEIFTLRQENPCRASWIIHWFNAPEEMGLQLISKGFYLSFGHMLFNEQSKAYRAFRNIPLDKIFLETDDAAWSIEEVYEQAARLRGISIVSLEKSIEKNFTSCFDKEV